MSINIHNTTPSFNEILKIVKSLSIEDKVRLEKEIERETLLFRAKKLDEKIPENNIAMEEIVKEIQSYRKSRNDKH